MEICADSFLINLLGNLLCTFRLKDASAVKAVYGIVRYSKVFLYTPGTDTDPTHSNYGFYEIYEPAPGAATFPPGVTLAGTFDRPPDLTGNLTAVKEAIFNGSIVMDEDTYPGSNDDRYEDSIVVTLGFNPGV